MSERDALCVVPIWGHQMCRCLHGGHAHTPGGGACGECPCPTFVHDTPDDTACLTCGHGATSHADSDRRPCEAPGGGLEDEPGDPCRCIRYIAPEADVERLTAERDAARSRLRMLDDGISRCIDAGWPGLQNAHDFGRLDLVLAEYVGDLRAERDAALARVAELERASAEAVAVAEWRARSAGIEEAAALVERGVDARYLCGGGIGDPETGPGCPGHEDGIERAIRALVHGAEPPR